MPAHYAAACGHNNIISLLCERDASSLMVQDNAGERVLPGASVCRSLSCVSKSRVQDNAHVFDGYTHPGDTPAHDATANNKLFTLRLLVQSCPSLIYGANKKGLRPIDLAQRSEIRQFLKVTPFVRQSNLSSLCGCVCRRLNTEACANTDQTGGRKGFHGPGSSNAKFAEGIQIPHGIDVQICISPLLFCESSHLCS